MKKIKSIKNFLLAGILCSSPPAFAQLVVNQGQTLFVGGIDFYVGGGFSNSGTITNNGIINVSGDWTNTNTYSAGTGTFVFNGNTPQIINHNGNSFYKLSLQGTGAKTLQGDADVLNDLLFSSSLLTTLGGAITIRQSATITNASSIAYINGLLFQEGTGKKLFPIGKNNNYLPVTLENITGGTTPPVVGIEAFEPNANAVAGPDLVSISANRYWSFTERGTPSFIDSPITLPLLSDEDSTSPSDLIVGQALSQTGPYVSLGQAALSTTAPSFITSIPFNAAKFFAIGKIKNDVISIFLPNVLSPTATDDRDKSIRVFGDTNLISPSEFDFKVFNQWGNVIFKSTSLTEMSTVGWTGVDLNTNDFANNGVYTFSLRGLSSTGKSFEKNGNITMIK